MALEVSSVHFGKMHSTGILLSCEFSAGLCDCPYWQQCLFSSMSAGKSHRDETFLLLSFENVSRNHLLNSNFSLSVNKMLELLWFLAFTKSLCLLLIVPLFPLKSKRVAESFIEVIYLTEKVKRRKARYSVTVFVKEQKAGAGEKVQQVLLPNLLA